MSRLLVFRSVARYDALGCFAERLVAGFRQLGHEVELLPYGGNDLAQQLTAAFRRGPQAVISFNGVGGELERSNDRLYSRLGIPYLTFMVDHPLYLWERLDTPIEGGHATFVDHTHVEFARRFIPGLAPSFLAHGAVLAQGPPPPTRDIELLFTGSYEDPEELAREWRAFKPQTAELFEEVATRCLEEPGTALYSHFEAAYEARGLPPEVMNHPDVLKLLHKPDRYVRARWRRDCLAAFARAGLVVDVYGHNQPGMRGHRVHAPVDLAELPGLMARAQVVLAIGANFPTGSHERVLTAMAAGAATVSEHTRFYAQSFAVGRDLLTYRQGHFDELAETVRALRADPARLEELQQAGPRAIAGAHTWAARAAEIAGLLRLS
jgi:spore maturation protein CgeB